jgi:hypothetical protein
MQKQVIPRNEVTLKYTRCCRISGHSRVNPFIAKGANTRTAVIHLKKDRLTGKMASFKPLATIKFPDQRAVAPMANRYPVAMEG